MWCKAVYMVETRFNSRLCFCGLQTEYDVDVKEGVLISEWCEILFCPRLQVLLVWRTLLSGFLCFPVCVGACTCVYV